MKMKSILSCILFIALLASNTSYSQSINNKCSIQGYYGTQFPFSSKSDFLTNDFSWGVDIEYKFAKSTHAIFSFAVNDFIGNPPPSVEFYNDYLRAYQYTAGIKHYLPVTGNLSAYGKGQAGLYNVMEYDSGVFPPDISHNSFGLNAGGGVLYKYDNTFGAFAETVFHNVFTSESLSFVTCRVE